RAPGAGPRAAAPLRRGGGGGPRRSSGSSGRATLTKATPYRARRAGRRRGLALLLDLRGLAAQITEVVELGAADVAAGGDLDAVDVRRVHGERALDAHAERHLADGEGLARARAVPTDHDTLEHLDAGPAAFD